MTAHFDLVQTDAAQPWFARRISGNNVDETWRTSENYVRERGALAAIVDDVLDVLHTIDANVNYRLVPDGMLVWSSTSDDDEAQLIRIVDVEERASADPEVEVAP